MSEEHLLIVEDESDIADILKDYLVREGYRVTVLERGDKVVAFVRGHLVSLLLLDIMLPGVDGKTICRKIRKFSEVPIIMITAKVDELDRIVGFELGADDYVCKPFSPREVVARVKAVLRRMAGAADEDVLSAGPIRVDRSARVVSVRDSELNLTPSEFDIFATLMESPNRVFTRAQLIEKVQGYNYEGYERTIDFHIKNLRKKIAECLPNEKVIHSSYGVGYKIIP